MKSTPNRDRAILSLSAAYPSIGVRKGDTLHLDLRGAVLHAGERGPGVHCAAVESALLRNRSASHIVVNIQSGGGSLKSAERIYAALRRHDGHKTINADRDCASSATIILMAGDFRTAAPGTKFLLHEVEIEPVASARWTAEKHERVARRLRVENLKIVKTYAERTGMSADLFAKEIRDERSMSARRAQELGLIHCMSGEERWINGRPFYFPRNVPHALATHLAPRMGELRAMRREFFQRCRIGSGSVLAHIAFTRAAGFNPSGPQR